MSTVVCTRPSTLSGALDDKGGLIPYAASTALKTIATNKDLLTRLTLLGKTDESDHWRAYKPLYDEADKRGGGREASDGTNIHSVVQALAMGADVDGIPEPTRSDGLAVWAKIQELGLKIVASEQFVYCPGLPEPCAGTLDLAAEAPEGDHVVLDVKSVGEAKDAKFSAMKWAMQTGIYALGKPYNGPQKRDQWGRPIIDTQYVEEWPFGSLSQKRAIILQVVRGKADVEAIEVNLDYGRAWARLGCMVRAERKVAVNGLVPGLRHPRREAIEAILKNARYGTTFDALVDELLGV